MDPSSSALASAVDAVSSSQSALSVVALKSAEKQQASVLQLFANASPPAPPADSGRGQQVDTHA
jgi:hypothetical protein